MPTAPPVSRYWRASLWAVVRPTPTTRPAWMMVIMYGKSRPMWTVRSSLSIAASTSIRGLVRSADATTRVELQRCAATLHARVDVTNFTRLGAPTSSVLGAERIIRLTRWFHDWLKVEHQGKPRQLQFAGCAVLALGGAPGTRIKCRRGSRGKVESPGVPGRGPQGRLGREPGLTHDVAAIHDRRSQRGPFNGRIATMAATTSYTPARRHGLTRRRPRAIR